MYIHKRTIIYHIKKYSLCQELGFANFCCDFIQDENTPLHLGAREGHTETVAALLSANADSTKLNKVMNTIVLYIVV